MVEGQQQQQHQEEKLFTATCYKVNSNVGSWLVDSGCTHHMTSNVAIFKELDKGYASKVKVGNGQYVDVKGKGTVAVETQSGTKIIPEVLYVPDID